MTEPGFKRLWCHPRRAFRGGLFDRPDARKRYMLEQSLARYRRRPDAYPAGEEQLQGELGHIDSFRFIMDKPATESFVPRFPPADDYGILYPMQYERLLLNFDPAGDTFDGLAIAVAPLEVHSTAAELILKLLAAEQLGRVVIVGASRAFDHQIMRTYEAAARSGSAAILMGMDLANGPDWTNIAPDPVRPQLTALDIERMNQAELKRVRRRIKQRQLARKGAIKSA